MINEKDCKNCGNTFVQYRTTQNLCNDCSYLKSLELSKKQIKHFVRNRSKKTAEWLDVDRPKWLKNNPPSHEGYYICYLKISLSCPIFVKAKSVTLDHVKPKSTNPAKRRKQSNFKPACWDCNILKGSQSLARCRKLYKENIERKLSVLSSEQIL